MKELLQSIYVIYFVVAILALSILLPLLYKTGILPS